MLSKQKTAYEIVYRDWSSDVCSSDLGDALEGIRIRKEADGTVSDLMVDGVFVAIGLVPQNEVFSGLVPLDPRGYIQCGEDCVTGTPGVFAAGDCRTKTIRQVTTAVADGTVAALAACAYADNLQ